MGFTFYVRETTIPHPSNSDGGPHKLPRLLKTQPLTLRSYNMSFIEFADEPSQEERINKLRAEWETLRSMRASAGRSSRSSKERCASMRRSSSRYAASQASRSPAS